jgi:hypothetical protein
MGQTPSPRAVGPRGTWGAGSWGTSCPCSRGTRPCWRTAPTARSPGTCRSTSCTGPCTARPSSASTGCGTCRRTRRPAPRRRLQLHARTQGVAKSLQKGERISPCNGTVRLGGEKLPAASVRSLNEEAAATRTRSRRATGIAFIFRSSCCSSEPRNHWLAAEVRLQS